MAVFKKDLTAIGRGGVIKHVGKGSREHVSPPRFPPRNTNPGANTMNDYAKATPMAQPAAPVSALPPGSGLDDGSMNAG